MSVLVLCVTAIVATMADLRCIDAAREGARLSAREDPRAIEVARRVAPSGADIDVDTTGSVVTVRVRSRVSILPVSVRARAVAAVEPRGWTQP